MKNIENLVTDLETSKALQEAGIEYETAFVWVWNGFDNVNDIYHLKLRASVSIENSKIIPAFTAGEMIDFLPFCLYRSDKRYDFVFLKGTEKCLAKYQHGYFLNSEQDYVYTDLLVGMRGIFPYQALAKLCLWCRKEGYL